MRWKGRRGSSNIEDRRGRRVATRGGGIGLIVVALVAAYFGIDPQMVMDVGGQLSSGAQQSSQRDYQPSAKEQELARFVAVVLADTEDTWNQLFADAGKRYQEPKLVMFTGSVNSACGSASAAMGPFYCPADSKVYIDLGFYDELKRRHKAPGDFAQAYVIAHEVGHHVQHLLGISDKVHKARRNLSSTQANSLSVKLELQADCLAGVWANHTDKERHILQQGDVEEALNAASAIGDDRLQREARGTVTPESFTHGTSRQRVYWFKRGLNEGNIKRCDTFSAKTL
ncbi:MAG: neutral zinc metallopeptidase [gamma proteobacterium symbiont of Bathyaustriella thionipta]|nr:neutral zinc metallopeptidase [gamma proteobacterium symbiont of Bathyaustriella thionipta]